MFIAMFLHRDKGMSRNIPCFYGLFHGRNGIHIHGKELTILLRLCQLYFAIEAPDSTKTYAQVEAMTGISKSTLIRARKSQ